MPDYTDGSSASNAAKTAREAKTAKTGGDVELSERKIGDVMIVDVSGRITLGEGGDQALKDKMRSLVQQATRSCCSTSATSPTSAARGSARSCSPTRR
jgi:hypothetical protein